MDQASRKWGARRFWNRYWYSSQEKGNQHRYSLGKRSCGINYRCQYRSHWKDQKKGVEQHLYSWRLIEGEDGVFSEESRRAIFRDGQCGTHWIKDKNSTPILFTPRFPRNTSLLMRQAHHAHSGDDTSYQDGFLNFSRRRSFVLQSQAQKGCKNGPNLWQEHHKKAVDAQRRAKKKHKIMHQPGTDGKTTKFTGSPNLRVIGHRCLGETLGLFRKLISHTQRRKSKDRNETLFFLRSAIDEKQGLPLTQRPGYQEANNVLIDMLKISRKDFGSTNYTKLSERKRLHNQNDPSLQGYLEWLSTNWAEHVTEEREPPTSSSSSHWSATSWWRPQSWSSNWQGWHQHGWKDHDWAECWE